MIAIFENKQFGEIRTVVLDGEPWFIAADICRALEISNPSVALERLDEDERAKFNLGRQGDTNIVSESGLYSLVLGSRKPEAKAFKRWITHEVIPAIRKTGVYAKPMSQAEMLLMQAQMLVEQEQKIKAIEEGQTSLQNKVNDLETKFDSKLNPTAGMDWYTITGYISLKKYRINPNDYAMLGKAASRLSREKGYPIGHAPHPSYGKVGVYSSDILDEVFARYGGKW